ncbi:hypothetical protein [Pradoshia sp.]
MTALAEGELAKAASPTGCQVHSVENSFDVHMGCERIKTVDQPFNEFLVWNVHLQAFSFAFHHLSKKDREIIATLFYSLSYPHII